MNYNFEWDPQKAQINHKKYGIRFEEAATIFRDPKMSFRLEEMTIEDKLKAMEILWDDLCRNLPDFSSPAWHENILKKRGQKLRKGKDKFVDWDQAKKDILASV